MSCIQADKNCKRKLEEKEDNPTEMDTSSLNPSSSLFFTHISENELMEDIEEEDEELEEDNEVSGFRSSLKEGCEFPHCFQMMKPL